MFRFVLLLSIASALFAQVQTGRIVGTVFDPNHSTVPNAQVTVTQNATNERTVVTTSAEGEFTVTPLNPGMYTVRVALQGFETTVITNLEVLVGQSSRADVDLRIGETATSVEVSGVAPVLDTESGTLGQVVTNTEIVNLPLNGRSFYELARLTPGANFLPGGGNLLRIRPNYESGTSISGVRGSQTTFLMDGVDITDHHQGGTLIQTSIDGLQEFKVQQSEYNSEYSSAGGVLNVSTKSGSNAYHGALFEFLRNDKLDARDFFAPTRGILKRNQFGADVGGPVTIPKLYNGHNKTFFFVNYEGMRERQGLIFNNLVPTPAQKRGDYSAPGLNTLYDPLTQVGNTRLPFPGNVIPANRLSPQALFFAKFVPDPNTAAGTAAFSPARALDTDQFTIRIDQHLSDKHLLFGRWSWNDYNQIEPNAFPALGSAPLHTRGQNVVVSLTSTLRPTLIHEFRFSYLPIVITLAPFLQNNDFYKQAGVTGFEDTGHVPGSVGSFPDFSWSGYTTAAGSTFDQRPKTQDLKVYEWLDSVTWIKGRHIVKVGAKFRHWVPLFTDSGNYEGNFSFTGVNTQNPASTARTGDSFADFLIGLPRTVSRAYPAAPFGGYATYSHFYLQDDFKVSDRLTLNLGLRYEYSPFLNGYKGQVGTFDGTLARPIIIAGNSDVPDLTAQPVAPLAYSLFSQYIQTSKTAGLPYSITKTDANQWAPRIGLAWRPFGDKTVVRGGYGIFYEVETSGNRVNHNMLPYLLGETVTNDAVPPNRTLADYFLGRSLGSVGTTPSLGPAYVNSRMGSDQHWSLGVQRQFLKDLVFEVNYVGNRGTHISGTNAFNNPPAGPGAIQARRRFPQFGNITYFSQDVATTYHALQTKFEKRYGAGLFFLASYTFSKSLTFQNTPAAGGDTYFEKALSSFDIPHNFVVSAGYELPVGKGKRFLSNSNSFVDGFLGGWQLQTIYNIRSGRPFTPTISRDVANTGVGGQRPNRIADGHPQHPTLAQWFDVTAFTVPANFTYGNSGGSLFREDNFKDLDFSIFKVFRVTEGSRLQFRAEFFNLTNTTSFAAPGTNIDLASGGRITGALSSPRQGQFALKYIF